MTVNLLLAHPRRAPPLSSARSPREYGYQEATAQQAGAGLGRREESHMVMPDSDLPAGIPVRLISAFGDRRERCLVPRVQAAHRKHAVKNVTVARR
jgi:hypothetical protein